MTRIARLVALGATVALLAAVGLLAAPAVVLLTWLLGVPFGSPFAALYACGDDGTTSVRRGVGVVLGGMAVTAALVGLGVMLGPVAATALLALAAAWAGWRWHRRRSGRPAEPAPGSSGSRPAATAPARRTVPARPGPPAPACAAVERGRQLDAVLAPPTAALAGMATEEICGTWQHSYFLLREVAAGPRQWAVVVRRAELLDELERRDPAGFARWLRTEPRPVSNPGRYVGRTDPDLQDAA